MREMQSRSVNDMPRFPAWIASLARIAAASIGLGVLFAWFQIYGTAEIPFPQRVLYWSGLIAVGIAASAVITPLVFDRWLAGRHTALKIAVVSALVSVPVTIGLVLIDTQASHPITLLHGLRQYGYVLVVSAVLTAGAWAITTLLEQRRAAPAPTSGVTPGTAFADRLPVRLRAADIYAVSAEDHYLRVHTSSGEELILLRLSDAVRELAGVEGLQVHRSWWVARQGVSDVRRDDSKLVLKLKSGAEAPVSRTYAKAVREAGWV